MAAIVNRPIPVPRNQTASGDHRSYIIGVTAQWIKAITPTIALPARCTARQPLNVTEPFSRQPRESVRAHRDERIHGRRASHRNDARQHRRTEENRRANSERHAHHDGFGRTRVAWITSLVVVSVFFGIGHGTQGIAGIVQESLSGCWLGVFFLVSGRNLTVPIVAHGISNTLALVLIYLNRYPGLS